MLKLPLPCLLVAFCYLLPLATLAAESNITIDDTHSSIAYFPGRSWSARISHCHMSDDAYNRSWHELVYADAGSENAEVGRPITMSISFIGTALYLYSLPGSSISPYGLSFNLDGESVPSLSKYSIDSPFFAYWNLSDTQHNLIVSVGPGSTFSFDYLIYSIAIEPISSLIVQARQVAGDNNTTTSGPDPSSTASSSSNQGSGQPQIGAIAGAIAASIGITSIFALGLAISIIKIRHQRNRVRRERREEEDRVRSRGVTIHLPSSSGSASTSHRTPHLPRYPVGASASTELPTYDDVMRPASRSSVVLDALGQSPYVPHSHLATISEVATVLSSPRPSLASRRDSSAVREDSLEGMPPLPPGLEEEQTLSTIDNLVELRTESGTLRHPGVHSDHIN